MHLFPSCHLDQSPDVHRDGADPGARRGCRQMAGAGLDGNDGFEGNAADAVGCNSPGDASIDQAPQIGDQRLDVLPRLVEGWVTKAALHGFGRTVKVSAEEDRAQQAQADGRCKKASCHLDWVDGLLICRSLAFSRQRILPDRASLT